MAKTKIADIIEPTTFNTAVVERTATVSRLFSSNIVTPLPMFDERASMGGSRVHMPFWADLPGNSEELDDTNSLNPEKLTQLQDEALIHRRGKAWSSNSLAEAIAGSDPLQALADAVGDFWARDIQQVVLIPSLQGIFATALASTHLLDISGGGLTNKGISKTAVITTNGLLGDRWAQITGMAVHSVVFQSMQDQNLITFEPLSEQDLEVPRFLGRVVLVDDGLPNPSGSIYTSYMFGAGAFAFGEGGAPGLPEDERVETGRDMLAGDNVLAVRRHMIVHPRGVAFTGSPAGATATVAELQTGANWTKRWENKNIRILAMNTDESTPAYDGTT